MENYIYIFIFVFVSSTNQPFCFCWNLKFKLKEYLNLLIFGGFLRFYHWTIRLFVCCIVNYFCLSLYSGTWPKQYSPFCWIAKNWVRPGNEQKLHQEFWRQNYTRDNKILLFFLFCACVKLFSIRKIFIIYIWILVPSCRCS